MRDEGELRGEDLYQRKRRLQGKEKWEKIKDSKYNEWYRVVKEKGIPEYLKKGWGESMWQRITGFRLRCMMRD